MRAAVAELLSASVLREQPLRGGDINQACMLELSDQRRVFAKYDVGAAPQRFLAEARGLGWLREAGALRVPEVLAVSGGSLSHPPFLVLELLAPGSHAPDYEERLGVGLAALHRFGASSFGFEQDNFIGSLPQANQSTPSWAEFYRERRLLPQLERAGSTGSLDLALAQRLERLFTRLPELVGPEEAPARLHGDLWVGNLLSDAAGLPVLIDPAVYGGHREMDLAMLRLFGGVGPRVFEAYDASYPLQPGHAERVPLYQLYPLLVHLNLFGASYLPQLDRALARYE
jgi:fructosamine-3-kinase